MNKQTNKNTNNLGHKVANMLKKHNSQLKKIKKTAKPLASEEHLLIYCLHRQTNEAFSFIKRLFV